MAKTANAESVSDSIRPADHRGAMQLLRTIPAKKEKIQSLNGEIGDIMAKIEGKKVHKVAARFVASLDKKEEVERAQILRDVMKLVDVAGWDTQARDLVDMAETASEPAPRPRANARRGVPDLDDDGDKEGEPAAPMPVDASQQAAIDKQRQNMTGGGRVTDFQEAKRRVQEQIGDGSLKH